MSAIALQSSGSGAGTLSIAAPITATNRTLTLPDATTTFVGTDATQTLTNKTIQGGAITSGTAVASTSGTSIDFTSIPSWVKRITVMFDGVSTNGTSNLLIQIGSGGITSTSYISAGLAAQSSSVSSALATSTIGFLATASVAAAASTQTGIAVIALLTTNKWVHSGTITDMTGIRGNICGGTSPTLSGALDRVRITTVNGTDTFDAGSINILYEG